MYLFDTDVLSNIARPRHSQILLEKIRKTPKSLQFTSAINIGEIYFGAYRVPHKKRILDFYKTYVFPNINILFFDDETAQIYGKTKASLMNKGIGVSEPDLRIAAIALQHKLTLVTGNIKHFKVIPGLNIENWIKSGQTPAE